MIEFDQLAAVDDPALPALRDRLAEQAAAAGLLDVAYRTLDTPIGSLLLAATEFGLIRVAFDSEGHDAVLAGLAERVSPRVLAAPRRLDPVTRQLEQYFTGRLRRFDVALDLRLSRGFRREVLNHLPDIAYGETASYTTLAGYAGNPKAVRAAASACATNPVPVVVPCHRVVRADGSMGGYRGGAEAKRTLLTMEAA